MVSKSSLQNEKGIAWSTFTQVCSLCCCIRTRSWRRTMRSKSHQFIITCCSVTLVIYSHCMFRLKLKDLKCHCNSLHCTKLMNTMPLLVIDVSDQLFTLNVAFQTLHAVFFINVEDWECIPSQHTVILSSMKRDAVRCLILASLLWIHVGNFLSFCRLVDGIPLRLLKIAWAMYYQYSNYICMGWIGK